MARLGTMPSFVNGNAMSATTMNEVFVNLGTGVALYDVLHDIDEDNVVNTAQIDEALIQFFPFYLYDTPAGAPPERDYTSHNHPLAGGLTLGRPLADDAVNTEQIDRDKCTLIYTGEPNVVMQTGVCYLSTGGTGNIVSLTVNTGASIVGVYEWDNIPSVAPDANQEPVVIVTMFRKTVQLTYGSVWVDPISSTSFKVCYKDTVGVVSVGEKFNLLVMWKK